MRGRIVQRRGRNIPTSNKVLTRGAPEEVQRGAECWRPFRSRGSRVAEGEEAQEQRCN